MLIFLALACADEPAPAIKPPVWPFPSAHLMDGDRVALPEGALPAAATPFPVERTNWRAGFSVVQTAAVAPGAALDPATLPGLDDADAPGTIQIWDLDTGARIRCFAELDAWPDQEAPTLLIRPLEPMTGGHRIGIGITAGVLDASGAPFSPPAWYQALLAGEPAEEAGALLDPSWGDHYRDLAADLTALSGEEIRYAFDFPVADATAPVRAIVESASLPTEWTLKERDEELPEGTWFQLEGEFISDDWLADDVTFVTDADGIPALQGQVEVPLFIHVPDSVRDAEPGTVPVWLFGHGIFSRPEDYLAELDDPSGVVALADHAGAILIGSTWRGLTTTDLIVPVGVGGDPGRFPELTDKLAQALANYTALSRLALEGGLLEDPALLGLPDDSALSYYGISLGGIEGSALTALNGRIDHAVAHVPGSTWSTMLERSSNWSTFEPLIMDNLDDPAERQLLYAASQLFWDPVDPASYVEDLKGRSILFQVSIGDEQVPNLTSWSLARGVGATLVAPYAEAIDGLDAAAVPLQGPALVQLDPQRGLPDESNRPAAVTGAHTAPRVWEGTMLQTARFLDPDDPGIVEHFCGDAVCSAENDGAD